MNSLLYFRALFKLVFGSRNGRIGQSGDRDYGSEEWGSLVGQHTDAS